MQKKLSMKKQHFAGTKLKILNGSFLILDANFLRNFELTKDNNNL